MKFFVALFLISLTLGSNAHDIEFLQGNWILVYCIEGMQQCPFLFNPFFYFHSVDKQSETIQLQRTQSNAILNQNQKLDYTYKYSRENEKKFSLTDTQNQDAFTFEVYDDDFSVFYRYTKEGYPEVFSLQNIKSDKYYQDLLKHLDRTFPHFPYLMTGAMNVSIDFPLAANFDPSILMGKIWWASAQYMVNSEDQDESYDAIAQGLCSPNLFFNSFTDSIEDVMSPYNFLNLYEFYEEDFLMTGLFPYNYPDPDQNAIWYSTGQSGGVVYASDSAFVIVDEDRDIANLWTTSPFYNLTIATIFQGLLVKSGINPLNGQTNYFNNTGCGNLGFTSEDLFHGNLSNWQLTSIKDNMTEHQDSWKGLTCVNVAFEKDGDQYQVTFSGMDVQNAKLFNYTQKLKLSSTESDVIYLDGGDQYPFYVNLLDGETLFFMRSDGQGQYQAFAMVRELQSEDTVFNHFILAPFFGSDYLRIAYSNVECEPDQTLPDNINIDDILSKQWYGHALYAVFEKQKPEFKCFKWNFSKSQEFPDNFIDILAQGKTQYYSVEIKATCGVSPTQNSFWPSVPLSYPPDPFNLNSTQITVEMMHFDGERMVIFDLDQDDARWAIYYLSTSTEFKNEDKEIFKRNVEVIFGKFKEEAAHYVDFKDCNFERQQEEVFLGEKIFGEMYH